MEKSQCQRKKSCKENRGKEKGRREEIGKRKGLKKEGRQKVGTKEVEESSGRLREKQAVGIGNAE